MSMMDEQIGEEWEPDRCRATEYYGMFGDGHAYCAPEDEFDPAYGLRLARARANVALEAGLRSTSQSARLCSRKPLTREFWWYWRERRRHDDADGPDHH